MGLMNLDDVGSWDDGADGAAVVSAKRLLLCLLWLLLWLS
jgi:hypothetical protein